MKSLSRLWAAQAIIDLYYGKKQIKYEMEEKNISVIELIQDLTEPFVNQKSR